MSDHVNLTLPKHHTQVDPEMARAILAEHQPLTAANHCEVCFERWPCETADLAATVLALYEERAKKAEAQDG